MYPFERRYPISGYADIILRAENHEYQQFPRRKWREPYRDTRDRSEARPVQGPDGPSAGRARGLCGHTRHRPEKESGKGVKRRLLLAHERRAEQNRRIEHGRIRLDQTVRQVAALGEPDKNLLTVCKRRGVQQRGHRFADRRAFPLPFFHAAAVRIPVIAAHVRPWIGGAE